MRMIPTEVLYLDGEDVAPPVAATPEQVRAKPPPPLDPSNINFDSATCMQREIHMRSSGRPPEAHPVLSRDRVEVNTSPLFNYS